MMLEKPPFVKQHLEKKADTFTVRLNKEERAWLEEIKEDLNVPSDSKALKIAALTIGRNVLHSTFTRPLLRYLFKKDRSKLEDYRDF
jgi:hypothetical protein